MLWVLKYDRVLKHSDVYAGTSMAAPQVAGAAALLLAAYAAGGANVTGRGLELKALLLATVQPVSGMAHKVSKPARASPCRLCDGGCSGKQGWWMQ